MDTKPLTIARELVHGDNVDLSDGRSVRLVIQAGRECYWWQPAEDLKHDPELVKATARIVRDLLEFGWQVVIVEVLDAESDAYGHLIVREVDSLGGVEWAAMTDEDRAGMVADILSMMDTFTQVAV